jgi:DNA processing protein
VNTQHPYWLGFNTIKGIGANRLRGLWEYFHHDLAYAWHSASAEELHRAGLPEDLATHVLSQRQKLRLENLQMQIVQLQDNGVWLCTLDHPHYPELLRQIAAPPPLLYVRGEILPTDSKAVAIVGTRSPSQYGQKVADRMASALAEQGITIVSGLARGLDSIAHLAALRSGGRTLAVLGNGIDKVYPVENRRLAEQIVDNQQGAILTEYSPGTPAHAEHFPARNRIISGLSLGVLVVEAPENSGALLTASSAAEQGREVFAIPGHVTAPNSRGTNRLIQDGAKLVITPADILDEIIPQHERQQSRQTVTAALPANPQEADMLELLQLEPLHVDEIAYETGLPIHEVTALLMVMKLKGLVDETAPMMFQASQSL